MQINWLWLAVELMPYSIKRQPTKNGQVLSVQALFWRLTIRWQHRKCSWDLSVPLITRLKQDL
jgi:hypothetical protein